MADYSTELDFARKAAVGGGEMAMRRLSGEPRAEMKADGTWVTEADRAVEAHIRDLVADVFPDHNVLGEEGGLTAASGGRPAAGAPTWVVDPIDGTNNYMRAIPIWATLVALRVDDRSVVGVSHAPALGETYEGAVGLGARWNGRPIRCEAIGDLAAATVVLSGLEGLYERGLGDFVESLVTSAWRTAGFGDFWGHGLVARGAAHVMVEPRLNLWDYSALEPIVAEAGGRLTRLDGGPLVDDGSCLTSNGVLHEEVLRLVELAVPEWTEGR